MAAAAIRGLRLVFILGSPFVGGPMYPGVDFANGPSAALHKRTVGHRNVLKNIVFISI
jgi:hypothetical protein